MPVPKLSRTINAILEKRGLVRTKDVPSVEPSANAVESPSSNTIATATIPSSPESSKVPFTFAETTSAHSTPMEGLTPLTTFTVHSFLFGPRPLPDLDLGSPGGQTLKVQAETAGVPYKEMIEHMVAWAYRCAPNWGEKTLEDVCLFYRDNRPMMWGF